MRTFITAEEVAQLLELANGNAFLRRREELERAHYFPAPMPVPQRPMRWRASAVSAWLDAQGNAPTAHGDTYTGAPTAPPTNLVLLKEAARP